MTRREAIDVLKKNAIAYFGLTVGRRILSAIKGKQWGLAAEIIYDYSDDWQALGLADAIWEGKK